jgi:hypothetical protein
MRRAHWSWHLVLTYVQPLWQDTDADMPPETGATSDPRKDELSDLEEGQDLEARLSTVDFADWHLQEGKAYFVLEGEVQFSENISEGPDDKVLAHFVIKGKLGGRWQLELPTRGVQWSSVVKKAEPKRKTAPPAAECRLLTTSGHKGAVCLVVKLNRTKTQVLEIKPSDVGGQSAMHVAEMVAERLRAEFDLTAVTDINAIQVAIRKRARELRAQVGTEA